MSGARGRRVRSRNAKPLRPSRELVLHWMLAARRTRFHFALEAFSTAFAFRRFLQKLPASFAEHPSALSACCGGKNFSSGPVTPEALDAMIELDNRWALDGRDPNSYGDLLVRGHDRPWGPEPPIFGTVRTMSPANTARKLHVKEYMRRFSPTGSGMDEDG